MGETLPSPDNFSAPEQELEQLADWIIRHEALPSESQQSPEARTEADFEKRNEIKDAPSAEKSLQASIKPMIPIKQVLQTHPRSHVPKAPPSEKQRINTRRLQRLRPSHHPYASAVLYGFGTGIIIVVVSLVVMVIKQLR